MLNENTAGAVTELELGEAVIPAGVDAESITVPVNPPRLPTLIVVDPEEPGRDRLQPADVLVLARVTVEPAHLPGLPQLYRNAKSRDK